MSVVLALPESVVKKLEELARGVGSTVEELVILAVDKEFHVLDPEDKPAMHLELCEKYLGEAKALLEKGDFVQASEKAWGAASQIVKAVAAKEGRELRSHRDLWGYVSELKERYGDREISVLWRAANVLHTNFYENWMPPEEVRDSLSDVEKFTAKLKKLSGVS